MAKCVNRGKKFQMYRKFDGSSYIADSVIKTKKEATRYAYALKKRGWFVRVTKGIPHKIVSEFPDIKKNGYKYTLWRDSGFGRKKK